jgi:hypothetical protein
MGMQDFLLLMVAQMQNMDIHNPPDNAQFMSQMAQMAGVQAMNQMTESFQANRAVGYIGKYVRAEALTTDRATNRNVFVSAEGYVQRVAFDRGDTMVLVDGIWFKVGDIFEVLDQNPNPPPPAPPPADDTPPDAPPDNTEPGDNPGGGV